MCSGGPTGQAGFVMVCYPVYLLALRIDGSIDVTTVCRFLAVMAGD
jgi:hypothetical protein